MIVINPFHPFSTAFARFWYVFNLCFKSVFFNNAKVFKPFLCHSLLGEFQHGGGEGCWYYFNVSFLSSGEKPAVTLPNHSLSSSICWEKRYIAASLE